MNFIHEKINKEALNIFFDRMTKSNNEIHNIQIYINNECMLRYAQIPYTCTDVREVYSLSKTFTSTVVGIASDMGLLSVEDYVLDFFPEIETENKYFKMLKIKHVLSMNTGHERCVMSEMRLAENSVEGFFSVEAKFEPGTHFTYNTGATCLLGAIINRVTGKHFFDFACEKLFYPLGIYDISWSKCHDGNCQCGTGLHISNDDIIKLGLMYYNNGIYNGKRILSEEWIKSATSAISDNSQNGTHDWSSGYGYQIWVNEKDGFRGDGASGQLCVVAPKYNAVVAVQAMCSNMQDELDGIFELLENIEDNKDSIVEWNFEPLPFKKIENKIDKIFKLDNNPADLRTLHITLNNDILKLSFSDGNGIQTILAGNGKWIKSEFFAKHMIPTLFTIMTTEYYEKIKTIGSFKTEDGKIIMCVRYSINPHTEYFEIEISEEKLKLDILSNYRTEELKHFTGTIL